MDHHLTPLDVTQLANWMALTEHREAMSTFSMRAAFASDSQRFQRFSLYACGLMLDFSKT